MRSRTVLALAFTALALGAPLRAQAPQASPGPVLGPANAAITVVVYCDYQCPYCAQMSPTLRELVKASSDVRLVYRDYPLRIHPDARRAAEAAACANEQGQFWPMHDLLFTNQDDLSDPALRTRAQRLGLDIAPFMHCLNSGRYESTWRSGTAEARAAGATATPTWTVNGDVYSGAVSLDELQQIVDQHRSR
jgi:protein-disulfide isomerase